jgi:phosphomannomutase
MSFSFPPELMVSVSGFRGRVSEAMTPELVARIAASYGSFLRSEGGVGPIVVGRDSRTSGPALQRAVVAGLLSVGCDVVELGVVPTPTIMLAVEESDSAGGIGVTASHNPAEWNALKFAAAEGTFMDSERMARFIESLADEPIRAVWDAVGTARNDDGAIERHLRGILSLGCIDVDAIRARNIHVAIDAVHGAGGHIMPQLLEALGCRVTAIGMETDGLFPREPEPTAENLSDLCDLVTESGAEIGLAVDPDVDRLSLVDEAGRALGEDLTLALASAVVLSRSPGTVVTNLSTSRVVEDVAEHYGGQCERAPVGEINVARHMQRVGAVIGGEGNGGVILPELHFTRDAPLGVALILQHLVDAAVPISQAVSRWPKYAIVKEKMAFPREHLATAYEQLVRSLGPDGSPDETDGLRLTWDTSAWLHVRPSGTEPVVRLIAEAPERLQAQEYVDRGRDLLKAILATGE